jgi:surfactin synthase thioesterase subunit
MTSVPQFKKLFYKILKNFMVYASYTMQRKTGVGCVVHAIGNMKQRILAVTQLKGTTSES